MWKSGCFESLRKDFWKSLVIVTNHARLCLESFVVVSHCNDTFLESLFIVTHDDKTFLESLVLVTHDDKTFFESLVIVTHRDKNFLESLVVVTHCQNNFFLKSRRCESLHYYIPSMQFNAKSVAELSSGPHLVLLSGFKLKSSVSFTKRFFTQKKL